MLKTHSSAWGMYNRLKPCIVWIKSVYSPFIVHLSSNATIENHHQNAVIDDMKNQEICYKVPKT